MGTIDFLRRQPLPGRGVGHPVGNERGEARLVEVLELATAACAEMAAGRLGMVWSRLDRSIGADTVSRRGARHMAAARGYAVTLCGNADDQFRFIHCAAT